jgi:thioredoxin-dependent peroxiredoxin
MQERTSEAFELGEQLTVIGAKLQQGMTAPFFTLDSFDSAAGAMRQVQLSDSVGKVRLLNIVNSLDTPVCHVETKRWENIRADLPSDDVVVYTVSMDLPFAQARWQTSENVSHAMLSSHRSEQFGQDYGVLIKEWRLLQRAVLVIDKDDKIVYAEYVPDQMAEPDYESTVNAIRDAVSKKAS